MKLDSIEKLGSMIMDAFGISASYFDPDGNLLFTSMKLEKTHRKHYMEDIRNIVGQWKDRKEVQIIISEITWTWIVVSYEDIDTTQGLLVIGPFYSNKFSRKNIIKTGKHANMKEEEKAEFLNYCDSLPFYSYSEYMNITKLVYSYLYHKKIDEKKLAIINKATSKPNDQEEDKIDAFRMKTQLYATFLFTQSLKICIRTGDVEKLKLLLEPGEHEKKGTIGGMGGELQQIKKLFTEATMLAFEAALEGGLNKEVADHISDIYLRQIEIMPSFPDDFIDKMFYDFAGRLRKVKTSQGFCSYVEQCCEYIEIHVNDNISVKYIADRLGISHEHLSRIFKHETGLSVVEYIRKVKIEEAKSMLQYTGISLVEISEKLAFSSQSHFCTSFKEEMKITPKKYRDNYNNNIIKMRSNLFINRV